MGRPYHPLDAISYLISRIKESQPIYKGGNGKGLTSAECSELLYQWDEIRRIEDAKNSSN